MPLSGHCLHKIFIKETMYCLTCNCKNDLTIKKKSSNSFKVNFPQLAIVLIVSMLYSKLARSEVKQAD